MITRLVTRLITPLATHLVTRLATRPFAGPFTRRFTGPAWLLPLALLLITPAAHAQEEDDFPLAKPPPVVREAPLPSAERTAPRTSGYVPEGEDIEPKVRIVHRANAVIEEYRINGRLYMVRIIPRIGLPYFLVDTNGDGNYDTRTNDLDSMAVPMWVIYSW